MPRAFFGVWWKKRYDPVHFRVVDIVCMVYLLLVGFLLVIFHKSVPKWPLFIGIHIGIVLGIEELVRWGERGRGSTIRRFIRTFYPIAFSLFAWRELDALIPMFFGNYWATDVIIRMEKSIFGLILALICYPVALKIIKSRNEVPLTCD